MLQEQNYEIEFATNGNAALDWLKSSRFDLVLLDINMPEMDGFEVCRRIRENKNHENLPIVFLSADNDRESILKGFELGGQDYVTKPFDSRELIVRVKTHISLKNSKENLEKLNKSLEEKVKERTQQLSIANENLEAMNRKLTELDDAKSEFLNLISHEIRTPLNGIILPVEMLKDSESVTDMNYLVNILDLSVKRLEKFSLNALLITRLKTRPHDIISEEINIQALIGEILKEVAQRATEKNISVKSNIGNQLPVISGERDLVRKCLLNIVENAVTFTPAGGNIDISAGLSEGKLRIEVKDDGKGIPEEIIKKGAEPFSRGKEYHDKSTGIGLPMAKMIMEAHGGELILSGNSKGGACVVMQFNI